MDKSINNADNDLLKRIVDLELRFKQDSEVIRGYRSRLDKFEREAELNWDGMQLIKANDTIKRLENELGR